jgi:hypothetical protein
MTCGLCIHCYSYYATRKTRSVKLVKCSLSGVQVTKDNTACSLYKTTKVKGEDVDQETQDL